MNYYRSQSGGIFAFTDVQVVPDGMTALTPEELDAFLHPVPTTDQIKAQKVALVQQHMDAAAQALGYDNIATACTYADEPAVPKFQTEGQAFRVWRSQVWAACYVILDDVQAGNRTIPTDDELIAELPATPQITA